MIRAILFGLLIGAVLSLSAAVLAGLAAVLLPALLATDVVEWLVHLCRRGTP